MLEKLSHLLLAEPPDLPGYTGKTAVAGHRPPLLFIATEDHDGHTEVSLSHANRRQLPTEAHAKAFFNYLGHQPLSGSVSGRTRHYVMRTGRAN